MVISGVKVGQVAPSTSATGLPGPGHARPRQPKLELPTDTTASIETAGLLGDRYVSLQLGGEAQTLKTGDKITFTESAVILERLIGKLVHNVGGGSKDDDEEEKAK